MAVYRNIQISFWTDAKVADEFTPEDKYFYLYLFTNPHTNLCGCYEISRKQVSWETGYSIDTVDRLIDRFVRIHKVILFSKDTKELLLLNWYKYNWTTSDKFRKPLLKEIESIKCNEFKEYLTKMYEGDTVPIPYTYGTDTTVTVSVTDTVSDSVNNRIDYQCIADMYNEICVSFPHLKSLSDKRKKTIKARLKTYSVDDFRTLFEKAESSDFLKGSNDRNWSATFDWLISDANMAKVLDGNYDKKSDNRKTQTNYVEAVPDYMRKQIEDMGKNYGW